MKDTSLYPKLISLSEPVDGDCNTKHSTMEKKAAQPIKILLAEDDEDDCEFFKEAIAISEIEATLIIKKDGNKVIQFLATANGLMPDIIFLDINMPCKNGKECLKEIRSSKALDKVPVVMLSASSYKADIDETFRDGANLYISKRWFYENRGVIMKEIFRDGWQQRLLKRRKANFVMYPGYRLFI